MNKSFANSPHAIVGVLAEIGTNFKQPLMWWTKDGKKFNELLPSFLNHELKYLNNIIKYKSQIGGVNEVNKFLKYHNYTIQLEPVHPDSIAAACIIEIRVSWSQNLKPNETKLQLLSGTFVPAVSVENVEDIWDIPSHDNSVIKLDTKSESFLYITAYTGTPPSEAIELFNLVKIWVEEIKKTKKARSGKYTGNITFPMVDYHQEGEMALLRGVFHTDSDNNYGVISQVLCEYILKVNHEGALAKVAVAVTDWLDSDMPVDININTPFIIWFELHEQIIPFCAYISEEDMKKPID